ncbi:hypothetical protein [Catalinimonas niigatensis]|uniref:hypothetical protein n=1 Tax=Catalinimonas niigatensis TaxID=1397264 RepID=UPI0026653476|nr:hypothetical protein [Catalinimonas niigatensis]WPP52063.1 hypothetical protein PZB72_06680 [Catalinimonas niigatensis]
MKKVNKLTVYAVALAVFFSACKEDDVVESDPTTGTTEIPETFSSFTPEQNKANLEDNGIELIQEMDALKDAPGVEATASFAYWMDQAPATAANGRILRTAHTIQKYQKGDASAKDIFASMRMAADEPASIQEFYNQYMGVYSWNATHQEWDYSKEGGKIVFKFPGTENGSSNNAELLIHSYEGVNTPNPIDEDYSGDLPTKLVTEVKVDGAQVMVYNFNAAYNQQGEPTSVKTSLSLNTFTFAFEAKNDSENVGSAYSLTKGNKILISMGAGAKGTFTTEQIEKVDNSDSYNEGDIVTEANAFFQVMDVKMAGSVNVATLVDGMQGLYEDEVPYMEEEEYKAYEKEQADKEAVLYNENINLIVFYASKKEKIADTEFYTYEDTYEYFTYEYDYETENYYPVTKEGSYTTVGMKFIFADDSKSDMEAYFGEGFDELTTELTKFTESLQE